MAAPCPVYLAASFSSVLMMELPLFILPVYLRKLTWVEYAFLSLFFIAFILFNANCHL